MLFLDISHIALMFPFNWGKLVSMLVCIRKRTHWKLLITNISLSKPWLFTLSRNLMKSDVKSFGNFDFSLLSFPLQFSVRKTHKNQNYFMLIFDHKTKLHLNHPISLLDLQNAWLYLTIGLLFILGSSLIIHMVFFAEEFSWVAKYTKDTLFVSAVNYLFLSLLSP